MPSPIKSRKSSNLFNNVQFIRTRSLKILYHLNLKSTLLATFFLRRFPLNVFNFEWAGDTYDSRNCVSVIFDNKFNLWKQIYCHAHKLMYLNNFTIFLFLVKVRLTTFITSFPGLFRFGFWQLILIEFQIS